LSGHSASALADTATVQAMPYGTPSHTMEKYLTGTGTAPRQVEYAADGTDDPTSPNHRVVGRITLRDLTQQIVVQEHTDPTTGDRHPATQPTTVSTRPAGPDDDNLSFTPATPADYETFAYHWVLGFTIAQTVSPPLGVDTGYDLFRSWAGNAEAMNPWVKLVHTAIGAWPKDAPGPDSVAIATVELHGKRIEVWAHPTDIATKFIVQARRG
jgi:hypothetical protein